MAKSPRYQIPEGKEGQGLAGVRPCGCVTAALALTGPNPREDYATEKDVREFYASMAKTGREVRWMPMDEIRASFTDCEHRKEPRVAA